MFNEVDAAAVATGLISLVLAFLSLDTPRWERSVATSAKDHTVRLDLTERFYKNRPLELYQLVPHLALRTPIGRRRDRFRLRADKAAKLPEPLRAEAVLAARKWIETVGALAEAASRSRVDLRPFLGTYHLGVIREGVIAVPIAMSLMARDELSPEEIDRLSWGLALVELAAAYNSRARQQREAIYFAAKGHEPPIGPVLRAPGKWERRVYDFRERFDRPLRIPRYGRWRWERWLSGIDMGMLSP
ncbi:hypothetical protein [Actinomadura sp. DC4]|uniref:hypothetical protein n=1 Tax=Actinomadura sp. DC4 TaxID=3055069 RepID=UPI0025B10D39|nr:hypothetical protein [Actinomadura sp. DC4]MDN3351971.1 hypothetical protein [Actinomadura sp. DC4]